MSELYCFGCGAEIADDPLPFRCPAARPGDDIDHVVTIRAHEGASLDGLHDVESAGDNPFVRFRELSYAWRLATRHGLGDGDYVELVRELDSRVAEVDGAGFRRTPMFRSEALGAWIKNETRNVSGSHKARHLMGLAIHLAVAERVGIAGADRERPLAIASCGNAALAAAVIARAAGRRLRVFVPPWAEAPVVVRLRELEAELIVCERREADPPGDPCYLRFVEAVDGGALPFACQGNQNGLTIDGGMTLGFELATSAPYDHLFVQVGGGALASSIVQALGWAVQLGALARMPVVHAVQTEGGHPLVRAVQRLRGDNVSIAHAVKNRSRYMEPWPSEPKSIASGILDDETYDWARIAEAILATRGSVIAVDDATIARATHEARYLTGIDVSPTGAAGLAGLMAARARGELGQSARVAVLFTGIAR